MLMQTRTRMASACECGCDDNKAPSTDLLDGRQLFPESHELSRIPFTPSRNPCTALHPSKERLAGDDANPHNSEPYERHNSLSFMRVNRGSHAQHTCAHPVAAGWPCARSMRINCQIGRLLRGLALDATNHIVIELKLRPYKRVRLLFAVLAGCCVH